MNWEWHKELTGFLIYADGACEPNPGEGGWGFVAYLDGVEIHDGCGGMADTTNNVMELTGVIKALEWLVASTDLPSATLYCDSQYVVKGCNEWRHKWKKHGWRKSKNGPLVKNVELWRDLDALLANAPAEIEWVKGHAGILGNERADELSLLGIQSITNSHSSLLPSQATSKAGEPPSLRSPAPIQRSEGEGVFGCFPPDAPSRPLAARGADKAAAPFPSQTITTDFAAQSGDKSAAHNTSAWSAS